MLKMKLRFIKKIKQIIFSKQVKVFHEFILDDLKHGWQNEVGVSFERFQLKDIELLRKTIGNMEFESAFTVEEALVRINNDCFLFVAKKEGEIIGYYWLSSGEHPISYLDCTICMKRDEVYSFDGAIDKRYRGLNLFNGLKSYAFHDLRLRGYRRVVGSYFSWNKSSARMNAKFGSKVIGSLSYTDIMGIRFVVNNYKKNEIVFDSSFFYYWKRLYRKIVGKEERQA
jgi:hypothetical protein